MGVLPCSCRAFIDVEGTVDIDIASISYDLLVDICPDCQAAGSEISATIIVSSVLLDLTVTFQGTPVGLPICETGLLTVPVSGVITVDGNESDLTFTLVLDENNGSLCVQLPFSLPILGSEICIPLVFAIEDCPVDM